MATEHLGKEVAPTTAHLEKENLTTTAHLVKCGGQVCANCPQVVWKVTSTDTSGSYKVAGIFDAANVWNFPQDSGKEIVLCATNFGYDESCYYGSKSTSIYSTLATYSYTYNPLWICNNYYGTGFTKAVAILTTSTFYDNWRWEPGYAYRQRQIKIKMSKRSRQNLCQPGSVPFVSFYTSPFSNSFFASVGNLGSTVYPAGVPTQYDGTGWRWYGFYTNVPTTTYQVRSDYGNITSNQTPTPSYPHIRDSQFVTQWNPTPTITVSCRRYSNDPSGNPRKRWRNRRNAYPYSPRIPTTYTYPYG